MNLPDAFIRRITDFFEPDGALWLEQLPTLLAEVADRWELTLGPPFELSYNYVAPARRADGTLAVLKLGVARRPGVLSEIDALRHYAGRGACRLLAADRPSVLCYLNACTPAIRWSHSPRPTTRLLPVPSPM